MNYHLDKLFWSVVVVIFIAIAINGQINNHKRKIVRDSIMAEIRANPMSQQQLKEFENWELYMDLQEFLNERARK